MEVETVRDRATAFCEALDAGDIERASEHMSPELRRNLGEVLALLPLPSNESTVVSVDRGGSGFSVVIRLMGETDEVELQTRWKDRDGEPTLVEASHLSRTERMSPSMPVEVEVTARTAHGSAALERSELAATVCDLYAEHASDQRHGEDRQYGDAQLEGHVFTRRGRRINDSSATSARPAPIRNDVRKRVGGGALELGGEIAFELLDGRALGGGR